MNQRTTGLFAITFWLGLGAPDAAAQAVQAAPGFTDVITGAGTVSRVIWATLFAIQLFALPLGALAMTRRRKPGQFLAVLAAIAFLTGMLGFVNGSIQSLALLAGNASGAEGARMLAMAISSGLWSCILGMFIALQLMGLAGLMILLPAKPPSQPPALPTTVPE